MKKQWTIVSVALVATAASLALVRSQDQPAEEAPVATEEDPRAQPIQFPHDTHAGQFGIDCQYCHFSAERSVDAGIPPVSSCMGCHIMVQGRNTPEEVAKLRDFYNRRETIPWVRIHKVADHVTFPHMRHIKAGLTCQQCHGAIEEQGVLETPLPEWGEGKMGWCVSCHVQEDVARDCTVCHY
jgi:Cytochrome c7 and related cytochrome c/Class III cytochrome C family